MRIPPDLRARLVDLRLATRAATGVHGLGLHASRNRGAGLEFSQYRSYEPGDEPRRIDWKLHARSDRLYVRESERDSPLTVWIAVDASASMAQVDRARPDWSRLDAARLLAACIIELALRQGDRFGVIGLSAAAPLFVPVAAGTRQRDRCHLELERLVAGGPLADAAQTRAIWERVEPGALVVFLSDFLDDVLGEWVERLAGARRDVLTIRILTVEERDFPFRGGFRFRDPETGDERIVDAASVRADFLQRFGTARVALARRFAAAGVSQTEFVLDEPIDRPLRHFFATRGYASEPA